MNKNDISIENITSSNIIPVAYSMDDFNYIIKNSDMPCVNLKFGEINNLPKLAEIIHKNNKYLVLHMDSVRGIKMSKEGIKFLKNIGTDVLVTNKPSQIEMIKEVGVIAIQNMFLVDSDAFRSGIKYIQKYKPDAVNIMPISIPARYVKQIKEETNIKVLAGGLLVEKEELFEAIDKGISSVFASRREFFINKNITR